VAHDAHVQRVPALLDQGGGAHHDVQALRAADRARVDGAQRAARQGHGRVLADERERGPVAHHRDIADAARPQHLGERGGGGDHEVRPGLQPCDGAVRHAGREVAQAAAQAAGPVAAQQDAAGLDEVGPGVAHLHDQPGPVPAGERPAGDDARDTGNRRDDDGRPAGGGPHAAQHRAHGGDQLVGDPRAEAMRMFTEIHPNDLLAVASDGHRARQEIR